MKTCFLFPGQGAQYPGMGKDLFEESARVKELFEHASESTGIDMQRLIFEGTEEELKATDKTQVAITLVNLAAAAVLEESGVEPDGCAGFSLGEYAALYQAGVIGLDDLFPIVKARGELMEKASRHLDSPSGNPGMAAVIGLSFEEVTRIVGGLDQVYLANYNSPQQFVVSGTSDGLERAEKAFEEAEAKRFIPLKVSGPFHCPLLEEAGKGLEQELAKYTFSDPKLPVYANVTGKRIASGEEARQLCVRQIVSTVLWVDEEQSLLADGFERILEVGPGTVLAGLWKRVNRDLKCVSAGTLEAVKKVAEG